MVSGRVDRMREQMKKVSGNDERKIERKDERKREQNKKVSGKDKTKRRTEVDILGMVEKKSEQKARHQE